MTAKCSRLLTSPKSLPTMHSATLPPVHRQKRIEHHRQDDVTLRLISGRSLERTSGSSRPCSIYCKSASRPAPHADTASNSGQTSCRSHTRRSVRVSGVTAGWKASTPRGDVGQETNMSPVHTGSGVFLWEFCAHAQKLSTHSENICTRV